MGVLSHDGGSTFKNHRSKTPLEELGTPDGAVLEEAWSEYRRRKGEQYPHHCISWKIVLDSAH
jgi:hypothetical protein